MSRTANLAGPRSRTGMVVLCLALTAGFAPLASAQEQPAFNEHAGTLPDGTAWLIRVPENWNGRLLRDLDFASNVSVASAVQRYDDLLGRGYAFAGLARHPLRPIRRPP